MSNDTDRPQRRTESPNGTLLSVVLPVYDEAKVLPTLAEQLAATLRPCEADYEIIFVNDGSRDDSGAVLDRLAAENRRIRVIHLARNFGHQAAVQAGLVHARGDAIVLMDSDLQDAPEAIPRFFAEWQSGYDVVYAVRTERKEGAIKRLLFASFHRFLSAVASVPIPADAGIFGLIDRRVAQEIVALGDCDRYFPGLRSWVGMRQIGIPVRRNPRYDAHPRVSLIGLFRLARTAIFSFSRFPLRLFNVLGVLAGVMFLGVSAFALGCRLFTDLAVPGWTSHLLVVSFFGALNAMGICIVGEYAVRIYDQVRRRPLFLVARTVNLDSTRREADGLLPADDSGPIECDQAYLDLLRETAELLEAGSACTEVYPTEEGEDEPLLIPFSCASRPRQE
jgi:polyisoprenyl-phosphate glycosyltransferase